MRRDKLYEYLLTHYRSVKTGKSLSSKATGDVCSRCAKVERVLGIDLDIELDGSEEKSSRVFKSIYKRIFKPSNGKTKKPQGFYDLTAAVARYSNLLEYERKKKKRALNSDM